MRDNFRQIQMAIAMNEIEQRVAERSMLMHAISGGPSMMSAEAEEQRLLQRAIEESKRDNKKPLTMWKDGTMLSNSTLKKLHPKSKI